MTLSRLPSFAWLLVAMFLWSGAWPRSAEAQDGNLYLMSDSYNGIWRFNGTTGGALPAPGKAGAIFVDADAGNLGNCRDMAFGPDQRLYAVGHARNEVLRFDGSTGQFLDVFVSNNSNGIFNLEGIAFGPDGHLYLVGETQGIVWRFHGQTGAPLPASGKPGAIFVQDQGEHFGNARDLAFGPGNHLFVIGTAWNGVLEYDTAGTFVRELVANNSTGIANLISLVFGPDGHVYLMAGTLNGVYRFHGTTGEPLPGPGHSGAVFIDGNADGLNGPQDLAFDVGGDLFVIGSGLNAVLRYDGSTGAFESYFVPNNAEGILNLQSIRFTPHHLTAAREPSPTSPASRLAVAPNPGSASFLLEFETRAAGWVDLVIFDVRGRMVAEMRRAVEASGPQRVVWDGRARSGEPVASGLYFCRVDDGLGSRVSKIVLTR